MKSWIYISEKVKNASNVTINPSTKEWQDSIEALITTIADQWDDGIYILWLIRNLLTPLTVVTSGTNRLSIDVQNVLGTISTVTTVTTVTTVGTVNNQANMWGVNAFDLQFAMSHMAYATSIGNLQ